MFETEIEILEMVSAGSKLLGMVTLPDGRAGLVFTGPRILACDGVTPLDSFRTNAVLDTVLHSLGSEAAQIAAIRSVAGRSTGKAPIGREARREAPERAPRKTITITSMDDVVEEAPPEAPEEPTEGFLPGYEPLGIPNANTVEVGDLWWEK